MKYISGTTIITLLAATAKGVVGALSNYEGKVINFPSEPDRCTASAAAEGVERVSCEFGTDVVPGVGTLYSKITTGACEDNALFRNSEADTATPTATLEDDTITEEDRNDGLVTRVYCARADVKDNEEDMSVLAKLVEVEVTYTYAQNGDFTTEVQTEAWVPETTSATAQRLANLLSIDNTCLSLEDAVAPAKSTYNIQDVLALCVWTPDPDVHLNFDQEDVTVTVEFVDGSFAESFSPAPLVSLIENVDSAAVDMQFLLIPLIWDKLHGAAGKLVITGNVELTYTTRRLSGSNKRVLQEQETAPFTLEVELAEKDMPAVTQSEEDSGSQGLGLGVAAIASAFVAMV